MSHFADDDFAEDEFEYDPNDDDADEPTETIPCPSCGAEVYEDAVQCPSCGQYISPSTSLWSNRPWWWIALGAAGVVAVIVVLSLAGALLS